MSSHASTVHHSEAPKGWIRHYIFSLDHKIIGTQYILLGLSAVTIGVILSVIMRIHLAWPNAHVWGFANGVVSPEDYLRVITMHGTLMVFFVLTTVPQSGFGNYFLPIQIGAPDMAFPRLNMLSFWLTFVSLMVLLSSAFVRGGSPISGWTAYAPLSAMGEIAGPGQGLGQTLWVISIALFCGASLMSAINFLGTTIDLRAKGLSLMRMPLTVWGWFITAFLALLAFGVLLAACILLLLDRLAMT
ncbi:MAG: cbb3-type cytochrome c oxidase subunit I, partial [Candidatus Acidiferrales bacterium]